MLSILIPNAEERNVYQLLQDIEKEFHNAQTIVCVDRHRRGKGWALREAWQQAQGDVICFIDADLDIAPRMLRRLLPFLDDYDVIVGSKKMTHAPLHRKMITYLSRLFVRLVFRLPYDTQTGLKIFRHTSLHEWKTNGYAFDVEILRDCQRRGCKIIEVPIEAEITKSMSLKAVWRTFLGSMRILFRCA